LPFALATPRVAPTPVAIPPTAATPDVRSTSQRTSPPVGMEAGRDAALPSAEAVRGRTSPVPWTAMIVALWMFGVAATLGFFAAGHITLARVARRARPMEDAAWLALAAAVGAQLGVRRPLRLLVADDASTPLTWGTWRPTILLPAAAADWSAGQRRAFLVHELAHVARRDCAIQEAAHLACALYWFHPGAWLAAYRLRLEREPACDDLVLADGASAPDYARQLLDVVRAARTPRGALSLSGAAMAAPSQLESRVRALLDGALDRRGVGRRRAWLAGGLAFAAVLPLAAVVPATTPSPARAGAAEIVAAAPAAISAIAPGSASSGSANAEDAGDLAGLWRAALEEGRSESGGKAFWVAYAIGYDGGKDGRETLLSDSDGWNADDLERKGPSLAARFGYETGDAVLLFRVPARGRRGGLAFDRVALRSARLSPALGGLRVVSLGRVPVEESLDWVRDRIDDAPADKRAAVLTTALSLHDSPRTAGLLVGLLDGRREDDVRVQAAEGLSRHPGDRALDALVAHARRDRSDEVSREAAEAIGDLDFAPATDALIAIVREVEDAGVRAEAVEALAEREPERVVPVLVSVADDDPEENVRREAVETLGDLPNNAGLEALRRMAMGHADPAVRSEAVETLNDLGLEAERAAARGGRTR